MHVVSGSIVFDSNPFDLFDIPIRCCFEAKRESAEYPVVCGSSAVVGIVGISEIRISISTPISISSISPAPLLLVLGFLCLFRKIFFSDSFVTVLF